MSGLSELQEPGPCLGLAVGTEEMGSLGSNREVLNTQVPPPPTPQDTASPMAGKRDTVPPGSHPVSSTTPSLGESFSPTLKTGSDWPGLSHMFTPEPITLSNNMEYAEWPGLSPGPPRPSEGRVNLGWRLPGGHLGGGSQSSGLHE